MNPEIYSVISLILLGFIVTDAKSNFTSGLAESDVVLEKGDNHTISCEGNRPLKWTYPDKDFAEYNKFTTVSIINKKQRDKYVSKLSISNITFPFVGYYRCMEENGTKFLEENYLFVNDDHHLSYETKPLISLIEVTSQEVILPCKPTSSKVKVSLKKGSIQIEFNKLLEDETIYQYDPHVGIKTNDTQGETSALYICSFMKDGSRPTYFKVYLRTEKFVYSIAEPDIQRLSNISNKVGGTIELLCLIKTTVEVEFQWTFHGEKITRCKEQPSEGIARNKLIRRNITLEDKGIYVCNVSDNQGHSREVSIEEIIYDITDHFINITDKSNLENMEAGSDQFQWIVEIMAYPPPKITWLNNQNHLIPSSDSKKYVISENKMQNILTIKNLNLDDYGNYTVKAENYGTDNKLLVRESKFFLNVTAKPTAELRTQKDYQIFNQMADINCTAFANPEAEFSWEFKPCLSDSCKFEALTQFSERIFRNNVQSTSQMKKEFRKSGLIKCTAINSKGKDEQVKQIFVTDIENGFDILVIDDGIAYNNNEMKTRIIGEGNILTLICRTFVRNFTQQVEWSYSASKHNKSHRIRRILTEYNQKAELTINGTAVDDEGFYTCIVYNVNNGMKNEISRDHVELSVRPSLGPTLNKTNMNETTELNVGAKLELICIFDGLPTPRINWYKNGEDFIHSVSRTTLDDKDGYKNASLTFLYTEQQDEGTYKCEGKNRLGTISRQTVVSFKNKSGSLYIIIIIILILLVFAACVTIYIKDSRKRKLENALREAGLAYFEKGQVENLNPDLGIGDQAELLPYDKKWEFPIENLKLGRQLGAGAFGVVIKGQAKGIVPDEEVTVVAVKMVKRNADPSCIRALASELKIMSHLGNHLNVLNLLGACTKNVAKRELLVIVEYCKYGNIHNYLYRNRNDFINQIDPEVGNLDFNLGIENLKRSYSIASSRSCYQMKYAAQFYLRKDSNRSMGPNTDKKSEVSTSNTTTQNDSTEVNMSPKVEEGEEYIVLSSAGSSGAPVWRTNYKSDYKGTVGPICTEDLIIWAFQVARGMEYLSSRKVLHGDLAARNILLTDDNVVKICDFGLAKSMYDNDNYKKKSDGPLPIKWMAIESIRDRVFSTQSDVWAFGVVLWEFFSLAKTPYAGMEADERLYTKLVEGYRMETPEFATQEMYQLMLDCWSHKPMERPSFSELSEKIGCFLEEDVKRHYLDLNSPYLAINLKRFQNSHDDYLSMVSSPNFDNLSSPRHYINEFGNSSGYLSMNSARQFSPKLQDGSIFTFDKRKTKNNSSADGSPIELTPMLNDNVKSEECYKNFDGKERPEITEHQIADSSLTSVSNPSYSIPPVITTDLDGSENSDIPVRVREKSEDENRLSIDRKSKEEPYVNSCVENWQNVWS